MAGFEDRKDLWPVAGGVAQEVESMHENQHELNHLHLGQILLPPQDLLASQSSESVVKVPVDGKERKRERKMQQ